MGSEMCIRDSYYSLSMIGANGAAYADDHHNTNLLLKDKTLGITVANGGSGIHLDWLRPQLEAFGSAIEQPSRKATQPDASVIEMTNAMQISRIAVQCAEGNRSAKRQGDQYELQ